MKLGAKRPNHGFGNLKRGYSGRIGLEYQNNLRFIILPKNILYCRLYCCALNFRFH